MKRILRAFLLSLLVTILICSPVFAIAYSATITVANTSGSDYANLPVLVTMNNSLIASSGYSSPDMLDTYITDTEGNVLPFMPADDKSLFVVPDLDDDTTGNFIWISGQTAKSSHDIVTGYGGKITTPDNADLEPHDSFVLEMSVYLANTGVVFEKQDCLKLAYNATTKVLTLTIGTYATPDYTLTATGVSKGVHVVKITAEYEVAEGSTLILRPNGVGNYTNIPSTFPAGLAHWPQVSDDNLNTTVSIQPGDPYETWYGDLYNLEDSYINYDSVILYGRFRAIGVDSWSGRARFTLNLPGYSTWTSAEHVLYSEAWKTEVLINNPITGIAWTSADIASLQIGVDLYKTLLGGISCNELYLELQGIYNIPTLKLYVDDMTTATDSVNLTNPMPDNSNDWIWYPNPYINYIKLETGN